VIPENTAKFFADPYFASVIQGVAMFLSKTNYTLTLLIASETDALKTQRYLRGGNVDGALVLSHHSDDHSYVELGQNFPIVFGGRPMSQGGRNFVVDVDNVQAAATAVQYLIDHGKTSIATIAGPQDMAAGLDRLEGWRTTLEAAGLAATLFEASDFTPAGGASAMKRILEKGEHFDGLFAASAQMASGALGVLRDNGLSVPGDIGITTIDNDYYAKNATPPLTTVDQPSMQQGAKMAEVLVRMIDGEEVDTLTIMPTRLIERDSV
ncbi:MAG: substrate-binding domain-containing protein, partial [Terrimesophilobacter sp.]